jgi:hypothetical protein
MISNQRRFYVSNGGRFKPAFAEGYRKQTMIDLREISTSLFENHFLVHPSIRLSRQKRPNPKKNIVYGTPMPELTITSPYFHSRVDSSLFTRTLGIGGNPMTESRLFPLYIVRDF